MTRRCYWNPSYIASQPFCITSKLTDKEAKELADFEESRLFDGIDLIKRELQEEIFYCDDEIESLPVKKSVDVEKAVQFYIYSPKKFYFAGFAKRANLGWIPITSKLDVEFHVHKHQQSQQLRASFLTR